MAECKACHTPLPERHGRGKNNYCSRDCRNKGQELQRLRRQQYYWDNRETILAKNVPTYARLRGLGQEIVTMFSLLPAQDRPEYAAWVMTLADNDYLYRRAIGQWDVDEVVAQYTDA